MRLTSHDARSFARSVACGFAVNMLCFPECAFVKDQANLSGVCRYNAAMQREDLPPGAENDPFHPPSISTLVHCIHCGEEYDSWRIEWRESTREDGTKHGFWCCPIEGCDGAGFGFDIFPVDPNYVDPDGRDMGWTSDNEEDEDEDGEDWAADDEDDDDEEFDWEEDDEDEDEADEEVDDAVKFDEFTRPNRPPTIEDEDIPY